MNGKRNTFAWSLKPLINLMILFGIRLDVLSPMRKVTKMIIQFFGLLLIFINFVDFFIQCIFYAFVFWTAVVELVRAINNITSMAIGDEFARMCLMEVIPMIIHWYSIFAVPTMFMNHLFRTGQWKELWLTVNKIQEEMDLSAKFYKKCRNQCYLAIGFLFLVS